jgi:16S rRNA (cytidine1402-2'-O)-methyltransferase
MASGLNGQQFQFVGYLPIDNVERIKTLKQIESESIRKNCTQMFIETPYRNNQLLETIVKTCQPGTLISIAVDLTSEKEWVKTKTTAEWKKQLPDLHKKPAIFSLLGGTSS